MNRSFLSTALLAAVLLPAHGAEDSLDQLIAKAARIVKRETGSEPTLVAKLRTDKLLYRAGDKLQAFVTVPPNSHIRLYYKDAEGGVTVLFPNVFSPDSLVPGGAEMPIPGPSDEWDIEIEGKPAGREFLSLVVSNRPFADAAELTTAIQRDGGQAQMGSLGIEEVTGKGPRAMLVDPAAAPTKLPDAQLGIALVEITTSEK